MHSNSYTQKALEREIINTELLLKTLTDKKKKFETQKRKAESQIGKVK